MTKVSYLVIILWISLENGECFDFIHSLGCVYPTLNISRPLGGVYHFSLLICYTCSLSNLKSKVDKSNADDLVPVPADLHKLKDVIKNVIKKMYIMLRAKILNTKYVMLLTKLLLLLLLLLKIKYMTIENRSLPNKTPIIINSASTTALNTKKNKIKNKTANITN